jgi:predicted regulator of Ras-like GTPase activity (Roadblock/LC7/MglB family)
MALRLEDRQQLERLLGEFLRDSGALCGVVLDRGGCCLVSHGLTHGIDLTSMGALAAGAYASTKELAKLIGETEFSVLSQQGKQDHLLVSLIDPEHLLLVVFDDHTPAGLVHACAKQSVTRLATVLEGAQQRRPSPEPPR